MKIFSTFFPKSYVHKLEIVEIYVILSHKIEFLTHRLLLLLAQLARLKEVPYTLPQLVDIRS